MARNLIVAVALIAACFAIAPRRLSGAAEPALSPSIIKTVALTNVSGPIPPTTLFTPSRKGLYRVSTYMTVTNVETGQGSYQFELNWNDDAGAENSGGYFQVFNGVPPVAFGTTGGSPTPGGVAILEAISGHPVTYTTVGSGETYSLYIVVEQLAP